MKSLIALAAAAVSLASADRHEGVWRFADAPAQHCIEQVRRAEATPKAPQKLGELPAAYAIRLKNGQELRSSPCFRLQRER
ncbi:MAG TPA: hypothetical protein VD906_10880 [Caulobacteraceae bacterium]|nr:hypothetical protein [Caulobacteraceae bacterium]